MKYTAAVFFAITLGLAGHAYADDASAKSDLGYQAIQQGNWAEAEAQLKAELKSNPDDPMRMLNLAYVLQSQGKTDEAASLYQSVLELDQDPLVAVGSDDRTRPMRAKLVAKKGMEGLD